MEAELRARQGDAGEPRPDLRRYRCLLAAFHLTAKWSDGGRCALIPARWTWTPIVIMPVNRVLEATPVDAANAETRALIEKWGTLHAGRTALGFAATLVYLWAIL